MGKLIVVVSVLLYLAAGLTACGGSESASQSHFPLVSGTYTVALTNPGGLGQMCADQAAQLTANGDAVTGNVALPACAWTDASGSHSTVPIAATVSGTVKDGTAALTLAGGGGRTLTVNGTTESWGVLGSANPSPAFATFSGVTAYVVKK